MKWMKLNKCNDFSVSDCKCNYFSVSDWWIIIIVISLRDESSLDIVQVGTSALSLFAQMTGLSLVFITF
jgi:hypothetical protein